jgi:hypothetical protein
MNFKTYAYVRENVCGIERRQEICKMCTRMFVRRRRKLRSRTVTKLTKYRKFAEYELAFAKIIDTNTNVFNNYEFDISLQTCQVEVCLRKFINFEKYAYGREITGRSMSVRRIDVM